VLYQYIQIIIFGDVRKTSIIERDHAEEVVEEMVDLLQPDVFPSLLQMILEEVLEFQLLSMEL
jgi:hypothetical protein